MFQGIPFVLHTGTAWEHLPQEPGFGSGMTCWRHLAEWTEADVRPRLHEVLLAKLRSANALDFSRAAVDGSHISALKGDPRPDEAPSTGAGRSKLLGPLLRLAFRPRIEGLEHVPASGAAIVAGNHLSFADHFLMPAILKRRITFLAKAEYFTGPGIKGRLTAFFFRSAGQIPVDRSGKEAGQAAIREGLGVLSRGELLGIYPEGTRSHDGRLYKGKVGVAVMHWSNAQDLWISPGRGRGGRTFPNDP